MTGWPAGKTRPWVAAELALVLELVAPGCAVALTVLLCFGAQAASTKAAVVTKTKPSEALLTARILSDPLFPAARLMSDTSELEANSKREKLPAGVYLVATPIGNLSDITLRALEVLKNADLVACEDTRVTRKLLTHFGIATAGRLGTYNDYSSDHDRNQILNACAEGKAVALASDAGMPLLSDPGYPLVRACHERGIPVTTLPGASAPLAALQLSGLPSLPFYFAGFLPAKRAARRQDIARLAGIPATLLLFEAPHRLADCLEDLAQGLGSRQAAVVREITKRFEEVRSDSLAVLAEDIAADPVKGEIVIVIAPPERREEALDDDELKARLNEALTHRSLRDAVALVAAASGEPRRRVYRLALDLAAAEDTGDDTD